MNRLIRTGYSLLELIVVLAIIATLLAIILPAVQKARQAAARTDALNLARQMLLAQHQFSLNRNDYLPCLRPDPIITGTIEDIFDQIAPFMERRPDDSTQWSRFKSDPSPWSYKDQGYPSHYPDGSKVTNVPDAPLSSVVWNAQVCSQHTKLSNISDGLASTIGISEKYGICNNIRTSRTMMNMTCHAMNGSNVPCDFSIFSSNGGFDRRPSFGDYPMILDVYPITVTAADGRRVTTGSVPGKTFQVRPSLSDCDPTIPQSSLPGGIITGFFDGSVRFLNPNTSPEVYWSLVTPAGGEAVSVE